MEPSEERRYQGLSPFELKNKLVELAKHRGERMMLNAGRGNPNWVALAPRAAFFRLGEFALAESERVAPAPGFGGLPKKRGIANRLRDFLAERPGAYGSALLLEGIDYACETHGFDADLLVGEWIDAVLGDHYPLPLRMLAHAEVLVRFERLYRGAGLAPPEDALLTRYYATLDIPALARSRYGDAFAAWLASEFEPIDFVVRLAEECAVVLMDGGGFDAPKMSVRVSLANLPDEAYEPIGQAIAGLLGDYYAEWRAQADSG